MDSGIPEVNVVVHCTTREAWLCKLIEIWRPFFAKFGYPLPDKIWISTSDLIVKTLGKCYPQKNSDDGNPHVFVSSLLDDPTRVGGTLYHELCHAALDCEGGHGAEFKKLATAGGLVGKMTKTVEGPLFIDLMQGIVERIGPYPHAALRQRISGKKGRNTRQFRIQCPQCGYLLRGAKVWLDVAIPPCPNPGCDAQGETMTVQWRTEPHETPPPFKPDFETYHRTNAAAPAYARIPEEVKSMSNITVSADGKLLFRWEGDETAIRYLNATVPDAAASVNLSAYVFASNAVLHLSNGLFPDPVGREMQMMAVLYFILSSDTGHPEHPGKYGEYAPAWDFDFDVHAEGRKIEINVRGEAHGVRWRH